MTSRAHYDLLDPLPVGACVVDANLCVVFWNSPLVDWTRKRPEQVLGKRLDELYPELFESRFLRRVSAVLAGAPPAFFSAQLHGSVIPILLPNGAARKSNTTVSLVKHARTEAPEALIVVEDVTNMMARIEAYEAMRVRANSELEERRKAEKRLHDLANELQRSNRELDDFASVVAHDLQAPIRHVMSWSEVLLDEYASTLNPAARKCLDHITRSAESMRRLVKDVLDYSRVTTRARASSGVSLSDVVDETERTLWPVLKESGGRIERDPLPVIKGDPTQLRQLILNLVGNGLKFRKPGVPPVVRVSTSRLDDPADEPAWQIEVSDNGIGFEPRHADQIFQMCRRLHSGSRYEGSGVGLAVCRRIVERHGGHIGADAVPDVGARFWIRWPLEPPDVNQAPRSDHPDRAQPRPRASTG